MNDLHGLLARDPAVAAAGIGILADAVAAQGAAVTRVDWHPPVPGTEEALAVLAADPAKPRGRRRRPGRPHRHPAPSRGRRARP